MTRPGYCPAHNEPCQSLCEHPCLSDKEITRLKGIEAAARNLVNQKGRYHTQLAYENLVKVLGDKK